MITKKAAEKKLKELRQGEYGSGSLASRLGKEPTVSFGKRTKPKPSLDELDKWGAR